MEEFKTPDEVSLEYRTFLKGLKSDINIDQEDSDWWIRAQVVGGVVSGIYSDQALISSDTYPQRARRAALRRYLELYFDDDFTPATKAIGFVIVTGVEDSEIPQSTVFTHEPTGNTYIARETVSIPNGETEVEVPIESVGVGQNQNLLNNTSLVLSSPPTGIDAVATTTGSVSDGRNEESNELARRRILDFIRTPPAGGTEADYKRWALEADDSVVDASILRFAFGFGTVGVVITAGTTDIDAAVDAGQPVVLEPSDELVDIVQDYVSSKAPLTDCVTVLKAEELEVDVTVRVRYQTGGNSSIPTGQILTQAALVAREVKRALYKTPAGGRRFGIQGYVVASEIEEAIDTKLSAAPYIEGDLTILIDRRVEDLSESGKNLPVDANKVVVPGEITIIDVATDEDEVF